MNEIKLKEIISLWEANIDYPTSNSMYVDIPFCKQYCNFCVYKKENPYSEDMVGNYLKLLANEMYQFSSIFKTKKISAIEVGGGSPSVLSVKQLHQLHDIITTLYNVDLNEKSVRTIEFNPSDVTKEKIQVLRDSIFNRVTLGVQSLSESVLNEENRRYVSIDNLKRIINDIRDVNPDININIDMMTGLNGEFGTTASDSILKVSNLDINKISLYVKGQRDRTPEFVSYIKSVLSEIDVNLDKSFNRYEMDGNVDVIEKCYFYFNSKNEKSYDNIYGLGPLSTNLIGFGPRSCSQIKNIKLSYERDSKLDFNNSKYKYEILNPKDYEGIHNNVFKSNTGFRF